MLRAVRFGLAGLCVLLGTALLLFSAASWRAVPPFFPASSTSPTAWAAFCVGLAVVAVGLVALAVLAALRTRGFSDVPIPTARPQFMQAAIRLPRYLVDVTICLLAAGIILSIPVLAVGGAPQIFLAPFWTTLLVIALSGGGVLGTVRV